MKYFYLILVFIFLTNQSLAQRVETGWYKPSKKQSFEKFLHDELGISWDILYRRGYLKYLTRWNPTIKNKDHVKPGQKLYIEVPYGSIRKKHGRKKIRKIASVKPNQLTKPKLNQDDKNKSEIRMNLFYTVSKGTFSENVNGVKLTNNQDSPITIGLSINNELSQNWGLSGSLYISKLDSAGEEGSSEVNIPLESGVNLYLDYIKNSYMPYFGIDYEQFSTFNTDELSLGANLRIREHKITYATVGFSRFISLKNKSIFFKTALSYSINSNSNQKSIISNENFNGAKFILYFNVPLAQNWNTHLLIKRHFLKGPTDLTITRIGVGIGHSF